MKKFVHSKKYAHALIGMGLDSVIAMTGHKDLKLADHYSKIDGEVQKTTSLKILDHINGLGLQESKQEMPSNVHPIRQLKRVK
jgi:hypothetical protein